MMLYVSILKGPCILRRLFLYYKYGSNPDSRAELTTGQANILQASPSVKKSSLDRLGVDNFDIYVLSDIVATERKSDIAH